MRRFFLSCYVNDYRSFHVFNFWIPSFIPHLHVLPHVCLISYIFHWISERFLNSSNNNDYELQVKRKSFLDQSDKMHPKKIKNHFFKKNLP